VGRILIASLSISVGTFGRKETGVCSSTNPLLQSKGRSSLRSNSTGIRFQRCASQIHQQWQTSSLTNRPSSPFVRLLLFLSRGAGLLQSIASWVSNWSSSSEGCRPSSFWVFKFHSYFDLWERLWGWVSLSCNLFFFLCVFYFLLTNSRPNSRKNIGINAHSIIKLWCLYIFTLFN